MKNSDPLPILGCAKGYNIQEIKRTLPRHQKFTPLIIKKIESTPEVYFANSGNKFARKIQHMMNEISKEAYRAKQFTRTQLTDKGILLGVVALEHDVEDLVLEYFLSRFPKCIICLFNESKKKTYIMDESRKMFVRTGSLQEIIQDLSKDRKRIQNYEDIAATPEEIFETLYKSQFISDRANRRYFKQMIPDKCMKLPGIRDGIEKSYQNHSLDAFFQKK